jgi:S1-C subfamily serine protease
MQSLNQLRTCVRISENSARGVTLSVRGLALALVCFGATAGINCQGVGSEILACRQIDDITPYRYVRICGPGGSPLVGLSRDPGWMHTHEQFCGTSYSKSAVLREIQRDGGKHTDVLMRAFDDMPEDHFSTHWTLAPDALSSRSLPVGPSGSLPAAVSVPDAGQAPAPIAVTSRPLAVAPSSRPRSGSMSGPVKSTGTAFLVGRSGELVTNLHVVDGCGSVEILADGSLVRATTTAATLDDVDLALLRVPQLASRVPLPLSTEPPETGQAVSVLGYPLTSVLGSDQRMTTGIVSSLSGVNGNRNYLQISAPVQPGNSGGPLLNGSGAVMGVVNARLASRFGGENVNFAVKSALLRSFLEINDVHYASKTRAATMPLTRVVKEAGKATFLVFCRG